MQRMRAVDWRRKYYSPKGSPSDRWVQKQIQAGKIPGEKMAGLWFVYVRDNSLELDRGETIVNNAAEAAAAALVTDWMHHEPTSA